MENAYIYLDEAVHPDVIKKLLRDYKTATAKTGEQLRWAYDEAAFPYTIEDSPQGEDRWFYLRGLHERYNVIVIAVESGKSPNGAVDGRCCVQITLPNDATQGDKGKANELCKWIAGRLHGKLQLFNGRIMPPIDE
ncbi:MAG TPA: DUF1885 family protein [Bacillales bacterium]|nr:DUF1885 family protein [Bacillales bacterium]